MKPGIKWLVVTVAMFAVLLGLVEGIAVVLVKPDAGDLVTLAVFLSIVGGFILIVSIVLGYAGLPSWVRSIRIQLLLITVIVSVLALANIGFVAHLMFISPHDLGLLAVLIVFSVGLALMASLYLTRPTVKNFHDLINGVRLINTGSLDQNVPVRSKDELGELATAFNMMLARLQESIDRERDMEKARRELIEAVSHDLRTPISSIRAMIESINDGVVRDEATVKRYLLTAQSEVENLSQLINDLFELSQIDSGLLKLHVDAVLLQKFIPDALEPITVQAVARRVLLTEKIDEALPPVSIDARRVQRVLYNLVQNAIRHTPPDGSINVSAMDIGDAVEVRVADTGEGISAEDLPRVFERSFRSDKSRSRLSGGAGLGLSISKGIVEAHGGRIWVRSQPGQGSIFGFTLPKIGAGRA